jgi:hypothetical protein
MTSCGWTRIPNSQCLKDTEGKDMGSTARRDMCSFDREIFRTSLIPRRNKDESRQVDLDKDALGQGSGKALWPREADLSWG